MALACSLMYTMATVHWSLAMRLILSGATESEELEETISSCLLGLPGQACDIPLDMLTDGLN